MVRYKKRRRYKYNLRCEHRFQTGIRLTKAQDLGLLAIDCGGELTIKNGYSWDGASGPAIDTANFMQGSLVHDALYQLIREQVLPFAARKRADEILREICRANGMSWLRAWWVYCAVRLFGAGAAKPDLLRAPSVGDAGQVESAIS